ncbi:hypothetical protein Ndes2526B_g00109 [Nannochloris sp. 'desiccata']|nr:hypothetical protein KSW81_002923 [Chlorella desiccata (nom. nud.)]KAH7624743.1 hypothetical protein NADE_001966 [Chlorella desiccata (nom. nud.)]
MQSAQTTVGALPCAPTVCRSSGRFSQQKTVAGLTGHISTRPIFHGKTPSLSSPLSPNTITPRLLPTPPSAKPEQKPSVKSTEFGYSRKDVVLIGGGLIGFGYILYYGLQYGAGMDAGMAGNWVQLIIFIGICFGWVGSYLYRVANKQMTYVKQLEEYEEAVMKKRLEEMPEAEVERVIEEIQKEKDERMEARKNRGV